MNVRITRTDYDDLRRTLRSSFSHSKSIGNEVGCILLFGKNGHPKNPSLLIREVLQPHEGDFDEQNSGHLVFSTQFLRRAMLRVRELGLAGYFTVHTHPFSTDRVSFSWYDDKHDPRLMKNLYDLQPGGVFGSFVAGSDSIQGRVWDNESESWTQLQTLVVVGDELKFVSLSGEHVELAPTAPEIFDRSLAITGQGSLARLSKMRVAFIGASGTGSLAIEAGQRVGVGEIVVYEFDKYDVTNLGRVLHARKSDAIARRSKADRIKEVIEETGLGTRVSIAKGGNITNTEVAAELAAADVIVGCVDNSNWARLIMSEVCHQYLIPYIDVGTEIGLNDIEVQSLDTRASYSAPGRPCLICSGIVDLEQVRIEGLSDEERDRVIAMGYTKDISINTPAVMELNMIAVGFGMLVLRHLLQPFLDSPVPAHIKSAITIYSTRPVSANDNPSCIICGTTGRKAFGDGRILSTQPTTASALAG